MTVILSAAGLIMVAFGGFITYQSNAIDRRIADLRDEMTRADAEYLRKDEHNEFKLRLDAEIAAIRENGMRFLGTIVPRAEHEARWSATDKQLHDLAERLVPRAENEIRWTAQEKQLQQLSDRLNELRNATTSTYTERDEIKRIQEELSQMRMELHTRRAVVTGSSDK